MTTLLYYSPLPPSSYYNLYETLAKNFAPLLLRNRCEFRRHSGIIRQPGRVRARRTSRRREPLRARDAAGARSRRGWGPSAG